MPRIDKRTVAAFPLGGKPSIEIDTEGMRTTKVCGGDMEGIIRYLGLGYVPNPDLGPVIALEYPWVDKSVLFACREIDLLDALDRVAGRKVEGVTCIL